MQNTEIANVVVGQQIVWLHDFADELLEAYCAFRPGHPHLCFIADNLYGNGANKAVVQLIEEAHPGFFGHPTAVTLPTMVKCEMELNIWDDPGWSNDQIRIGFLVRLLRQPNRRLVLPQIGAGRVTCFGSDY